MEKTFILQNNFILQNKPSTYNGYKMLIFLKTVLFSEDIPLLADSRTPIIWRLQIRGCPQIH